MKIKLYMAISVDGFIASKDGDSDWVSEIDAEIFEKEISTAGCIILGRTTFEQYQDDLYPAENVTNIVLTSKNTTFAYENVEIAANPSEAIKIAEQNGYSSCLLIGGGETNAAFLEEGLIDELILSVHPLILKEGIRLFEGHEDKVRLKKTKVVELPDDIVHLHYQIT